jgi:hypothetical protein
VTIQVGVELGIEGVEPLVDVGEPRFHPILECIEPTCGCIEPTCDCVESRVHQSAEGIDPGAEPVDPGPKVEEAPKRRGSKEADRGPDGGVHPGERSTASSSTAVTGLTPPTV